MSINAHPRRRTATWARCALLLTFAFVFAGCRGEGDSEQGSPAQATPPEAPAPRFATADALVEEFNRLYARDQLPTSDFISLYYAESPEQSLALDFAFTRGVFAEFDAEFHQRFGQSFLSEPMAPLPTGAQATIVDRQDRRATAVVSGPHGSTDLPLVEVGGSWWISGLDLEDSPDFRQSVEWAKANADPVRFSRQGMPDLLRRLRAGEFFSPQAVHLAYDRALDAAGVR